MTYAIAAVMLALLLLGVNPEKDSCQHGQNSCSQVPADDRVLPAQITDKNAPSSLSGAPLQ